MSKKKKNLVIIKKSTYDDDCEHSGAWKIAFADLMTAVMAFFMLLWVIGGTSEDDKRVIAEYFKDPSVFDGSKDVIIPDNKKGVTNSVIDNGGEKDIPKSVKGNDPNNEKPTTDFEKLLKDLNKDLSAHSGFKLNKTEDGIEIVMYDDAGRSFFSVGSSEISDQAILFLDQLSQYLMGKTDISINIVGHTDALRYKREYNYDNFDLSVDRAQSIRRALIELGMNQNQFDLITGKADRELIKEEGISPYSPKQRRVVIGIKRSEITP